MSRPNLTPKVVFGNMVADDTAGSSVTNNVTATNRNGWTDATPVLITGYKLSGHNAITARVFDPTSAHVAQSGFGIREDDW
ncbi:uncharacterized protein G2W53_011750 [Senna tora]|uniref:Uncharacterized protein n=1 Tax=Senna tora TaxID=362788 RepID=A0A835CB33_9FABA|nr:uncharacterized protein G2W53_011750 [Senna tora]